MFFSLLIGLNISAYYAEIYLWKFQTIPFYALLINNFIILFLVYLFFIFEINKPITLINKEVLALLNGQDFNRIKPTSIDEIGIFTHFFNKITKNLENISYNLKKSESVLGEIDLASKIQKDVLPKKAKGILGLDIVAKTRSAEKMGGDSFDFIQSGDNTLIYIGDVTGHGIPSGIIMMVVNTLIHVFAQEESRSDNVIIKTNKFLAPRISQSLYMTAVLLRWDAKNQKLYYSGAGHEHILIYRAKTQDVYSIKSGGIALGMIPDVSPITKEKEIHLDPDDAICLYTDGITEASNKQNEMYGLKRLMKSFKNHAYRPQADTIFNKITTDFSDYVGEYTQIDDITMIIIKYKGKNTPSKETIQLSINQDIQPDTKTQKKWNWT